MFERIGSPRVLGSNLGAACAPTPHPVPIFDAAAFDVCATTTEDLQDCRPTIFFGVPRMIDHNRPLIDEMYAAKSAARLTMD